MEKKDRKIRFQSANPTVKVPLPTKTTYEAAARHYVEIDAPVKCHMHTLLTEFTVDEQTRSRLVRLNKDGEALKR
jgi:hypothetical protein